MKDIRYEVVRGQNLTDFEKMVVSYCMDGWLPQGGVFIEVHESFGSQVYYQAMTKNVFRIKTTDQGSQNKQKEVR